MCFYRCVFLEAHQVPKQTSCADLDIEAFKMAVVSASSRGIIAIDAIFGRLDAIQNTLGGLVDGHNYRTHVIAQASNLQRAMQSMAPSLNRALKEDPIKETELFQKIVDIGFPADVESNLLGNLNQMLDPIPRQSFQNYKAFYKYLKRERWEHLLSDATRVEKLHELYEDLVDMGLHKASEPTFQAITALYMICCDGMSVAKSMPTEDKKNHLDYVKSSFRSYVEARGASPFVFVNILPENPDTFRSSYPTFNLEDPHDCPIDGVDFALVAKSIKCRGRSAPAPSMNVITPAPSADMPKMMNMMFSMFQQLSQRPDSDDGNLIKFLNPNAGMKKKLVQSIADISGPSPKGAYVAPENHAAGLGAHVAPDDLPALPDMSPKAPKALKKRNVGKSKG